MSSSQILRVKGSQVRVGLSQNDWCVDFIHVLVLEITYSFIQIPTSNGHLLILKSKKNWNRYQYKHIHSDIWSRRAWCISFLLRLMTVPRERIKYKEFRISMESSTLCLGSLTIPIFIVLTGCKDIPFLQEVSQCGFDWKRSECQWSNLTKYL